MSQAAAKAAASSPQKETLRFSDGETMDLTKLPDIDEKTWAEVKEYLQSNQEVAKSLQSFASNPEAVRNWLSTKAMVEYYNKKIEDGETGKFDALKDDPEMAPIFKHIEKDGIEAAIKYCTDEELMLKMSAKMGGLPDELKAHVFALKKETAFMELPGKPITSLHEACKFGNAKAVQEFLSKGVPCDIKDANGITPIAYAIGGNHLEVVKGLMQIKADPHNVDVGRNSGLHYAAGYGRKDLVEFLLNSGADANRKNAQGQTPLKVASRNKQAVTMKLLESAGGKMD
jgi:hypothetical protein